MFRERRLSRSRERSPRYRMEERQCDRERRERQRDGRDRRGERGGYTATMASNI